MRLLRLYTWMNNMDQAARSWDKLPNETTKAFAAFCVYRDLPPYGDNSRSIDRVKKELGLSSGNNVNGWSSKFSWVERARSFDAYKSTRSITLTEVAQDEYAKSMVTATSARLVGLGRIVEKLISKTMDKIDNNEVVDAGDIKRLVEMVKTIDDLGRRQAGLPTTYITKPSEATPDDEDQVFVIGGKRDNETIPALESGEDYGSES